jgi:hypothetical protein
MPDTDLSACDTEQLVLHGTGVLPDDGLVVILAGAVSYGTVTFRDKN